MVKLVRLRALRERKAQTQGELAEQAGVSRATVARLEAGYGAQPPTARKLAAALGVQPEELMEPEG